MLDLTQKTFSKIKSLLQRQKKTLESGLKSIKAGDPLLSSDLPESSEPGTDSWMADVYSKTAAFRQNLENLLNKTKQALMGLKKGNYGHCEKCGQHIEVERLEAMPTATLCLSCSKKNSQKTNG